MFRIFKVENDRTLLLLQGWGRGYVVIPAGNVLHGLDIEDLDIDVHGGVTWAAPASNTNSVPQWVKDTDWIVGFDTSNGGDNLIHHNKEYVEQQTSGLLIQLMMLEKKLKRK